MLEHNSKATPTPWVSKKKATSSKDFYFVYFFCFLEEIFGFGDEPLLLEGWLGSGEKQPVDMEWLASTNFDAFIHTSALL